MDELVERVHFGELFDAYSEILTEKQREVCDMLLGGDLTVAELASLLGVSRQGAHDLVHRARERLDDIEDSLGLLELRKRYETLVALIRDNATTLPDEFMELVSKYTGRLDSDV
ncbi:MAG: DNA-binding protein [Synergistaceae bacterium]|nr:DNA-binding protein [Synergistaceae bacterium]